MRGVTTSGKIRLVRERLGLPDRHDVDESER